MSLEGNLDQEGEWSGEIGRVPGMVVGSTTRVREGLTRRPGSRLEWASYEDDFEEKLE